MEAIFVEHRTDPNGDFLEFLKKLLSNAQSMSIFFANVFSCNFQHEYASSDTGKGYKAFSGGPQHHIIQNVQRVY